MSFCSNCGNQLEDNARFCQYCGVPIQQAPSVIPQNQQEESQTAPIENKKEIKGNFPRSLLCARMAAAKKSLSPVWGHRQEKQAGEGGVFGGSPLASTAEMRPNGGRRPCPLRRRKLRASTAEM